MKYYGKLAGIVLYSYCLYLLEFGSCSTLPADWRSRIHSSILTDLDSQITSANWSSRSDIIEDESPSGMRTGVQSNGQMFPYNYWPNNGKCIPFRLHPAFASDTETRRRILYALRTIERRTQSCLTFRMWSNEPEYISIQPGRYCEADVGRTPGFITRVRLGRECMKQGVILHELLHALGFLHEHARPDRDDYLEVFPDHVVSGKYDPNFIILRNMSNHGIQYDFESIMHYAPWAFAENPNKPTMVPKVRTPVKMGQQQFLSALDVNKICKAYGCIDEDLERFPEAAPVTCTVDSYVKAPVLTTTVFSSTLSSTTVTPTRRTTTKGAATNEDGSFFCQYYSDHTNRCYTRYRDSGRDEKLRIEAADKAFSVTGIGNPIKGSWTNDDGFFRADKSGARAERRYIGTCILVPNGPSNCAYPPPPCDANKAKTAGCVGGAMFRVANFTGRPGGSIKSVRGK